MKTYTLISDLHLSEETEETVFSILSYVAKGNDRVAILGDFYDTVYRTGTIDAKESTISLVITLQKIAYSLFLGIMIFSLCDLL